MRLFLPFLFLSFLVIVSCSSAPAPQKTHAQQSENIQLVMQRMQQLVFEPGSADEAVISQQRDLAAQFVYATEDAITTLRLISRDPAMEPYIELLTDRALQMQRVAATPGKWEFSQEMDQLFEACNSCHERFRDSDDRR